MEHNIRIMTNACGYSYEDVVGRSRSTELSLVRQLVWYRLYKSGYTYSAIAQHFSNRTHSCVLQGIVNIKGLLYIGDKFVMAQYENMELAER